jgi:hypothetical protein
MIVALVYAVIILVVMGFFLLRHALQLLQTLWGSDIVRSFMHVHIFPILVERTHFSPPISRLNILLQTLYYAVTLSFNLVGIHNSEEGSARAVDLAAAHLIPLLFGDRLSFAADLLGVSTRNYQQIHKSLGAMTVLQVFVHVMLELSNGSLKLHVTQGRLTLLVRPGVQK